MRTTMLAVLALTVTCGLACDARAPIGADTTLGPGTDGVTTSDPQEPAPDPAQVRAELMARWNAAADSVPATLDFHWSTFDQFPHPTYKGGTVEAYQQFAVVLLAFFHAPGNFGFLAQNHLFTLHLTYVFPSGQVGLDTTFQQLATTFASPTAYGDLSDSMRTAFADVAARIASES
jgi:hypothetical protein